MLAIAANHSVYLLGRFHLSEDTWHFFCSRHRIFDAELRILSEKVLAFSCGLLSTFFLLGGDGEIHR